MGTDLASLTEDVGDGLWRWSVWVEADSPEEIEEVVYTLDSSFFNPVRRTKERDSHFKIADVASGSFTVFARIKLTSGGYLKMERRLSRDSADHGLSHQRAKPIILAVDDDAGVIEAVIQDLRRRYGASFRLLRATSGQEGLEILQKAKAAGGDVALILSDQRMPGIRGVEFLSLAAQYYPLAKIALLTAYLDAEAAISAINICKIDYYLMKPWDPPEEKLYPVIDELLAAWQPIRGVQFYGS